MSSHHRSKTLATWLAVLTGPTGLHRLYVHGLRDALAWLHLPPTAMGLFGLLRLLDQGQDDRLAWMLLPLLGLMISAGMLTAVVWGLTPDARWDERHNPGQPASSTGWGPVLGVIVALLVGAAVLMSSIAYGIQKYFEWELRAQAAPSDQGLVQAQARFLTQAQPPAPSPSGVPPSRA
jgi:hypothetical protein